MNESIGINVKTEMCDKFDSPKVNMEPWRDTQYYQTQHQNTMVNAISNVMHSITKYTTHISTYINGNTDDSADGTVVDRKIIIQLDKLVKYFGRLCIREANFFARKGKEQIALAIVLTAVDFLKYDEIPKEHRQRIVDDLYCIGSIDCADQEVLCCRIKLRQIFQRRRCAFFRLASSKKKASKPADASHAPHK